MADTDYGAMMDGAAQAPQDQQAAPAGPVDYGSLMDDTTKAQATLAVASSSAIPPDRAVQNAILAKRYKTTPDVVDAYPDDFRKQALMEDTRQRLANAPKLANAIAQNPQAASLVQHQIDQLAQMEQTLQPRGRVADIWAGLQHTGSNILGAWDKGAVALDQWIQDNLPWLHENVPGFMTPEQQQQYEERGQFLQGRAAWQEYTPQRWTGNVASVVPYLLFSGAAPEVMGGTEGSALTQSLEQQGVDEQTAQRAGTVEGGLTALTAMLPMGRLVWGQGASTLAKSVVKAGAAGAGMGVLQSLSTDEGVSALLSSAGYDDLAKQYAPTAEKAADSALFMAAFHLGSEGVQRLAMGHLADVVRANRAENDAQRLETISQISQQASLREGDPDMFKDTVRSMAEDGDLHTVYVDGQAFKQSMDKNGITMDELQGLMPDVARQVNEALHTNGDVAIPVEDYATHLAGSKIDADILPQIKTSPDGMTLNESRMFQEQQADKLKEDAANMVKEQTEAQAFRQSQDNVENSIRGQLDALNRFPPDVNRIYAKVQTGILSRLAAREGITPEEAYAKYGGAVRGEQPTGAGLQEGMGQSTTSSLDDVKQAWDQAGIIHDMHEKNGVITLGKIVVPEGARGKGVGSDAMRKLTDYADRTGQRIALSPSGDFGGTKGRLVDFYKKLGFKENKGRTIDHSISESMVREPQALKQEGERRTNGALRKTINEMSVEELRGALLKHELTGIPNKRAYEDAKKLPYQASIDVDSLKWVNDNLGHESGDALLKAMADALARHTNEGYHVSGDEFYAQGNTPEELHETLGKARETLKGMQLEHVDADGNRTKFTGGFSYGIGKTFAEAEQGLHADKSAREASGERAERGAVPPGAVKTSPEGREISLHADTGGRSEEAKHVDEMSLEELRHEVARLRAAKQGGVLNQEAIAQEHTPEFKKWAGTDEPVIEAAVPRGFYSTVDRSITLLKDADLSTYLHETGHWALDLYGHLAADAETHPEIAQDMQKILDWFGVKDAATWNKMSLEEQRPFHEQFARGFEAYLMEGKAPSMELRPAFQRIRAWMNSIYKSLKALNVDLTPEVRGVFDRMLASDEAIKEAEVARGYSLPDTKPENISDADWATLTKLQDQAHADAVDELQAKSIKDMQWLSNLKAKTVKEYNREAAEQRRGVREEVAKQVDEMPVYKAEKWLKTGEMTTDKGEEIKAEKGYKLNTDDVRRMFETLPEGERIAPKDLAGMTSPDGLHPDLVAEMFGYSSGEKLLSDLATREPKDSVIDGMTDQRMLEEHGELSSPQAINEAANAAVANAARTRFTATLLKVMAKSPIPMRQLINGAKEAADAAVGAKKVGELRPAQYDRQEARANKRRMELMAKDPAGAFEAQRAALLNEQLGIAAREAQADMKELGKLQAKYDKKSIRTKMDPDILDQIDALRDRFDFRKNPTPDKKIEQLQTWVQSQKDMGYSPVESADMLNPAVRMHYEQMTVDQMRGLLATLKSMEKLARGRKTLTVEGQQHDLQEVVNGMVEKMKERGEKFTDAELVNQPRKGVDPTWRIALWRVESFLRGAGADMKAQHFKANQYDLHQIMGPFHRFLFEPVFAANYKFLDLRREVSNDFRAAAEKLGGREWQESLHDVVDNHNLMDNALDPPSKRKLTRGDLIGMALHVGNESNFDKLTKGMGWKPEDVWQALHDNMRQADWEAARVMGEAAGKHWDDMVEMNRNLGNTTPEKIQPRPFNTKYGEMPGWYAPVRYDSMRSKLAEKKAAERAVNPAEGLFNKGYYRADTTTNGSLNARVSGYHDFVDLDWHATEQAIHDGLRDLAYREALVDSSKILQHKDFRKQFMRTYGREAYDSLDEWLGRIVNNSNMEERTSRFVKIMAASRRAVVASGIALRISTMLKHGGSAGLKSMGYFAGGGEKYFLARVKGVGLDHANQVAEALAKFPEIRARAEQQDRDFNQTISSLLEPESLHGKAERFGHAGVAALDFLTAVPTAHAAYDWATTEGIPKRLGGTGKPMSHEDAVKFASSMVREAHGTNIESARSNLINTRSELVKMLTVLHGFMNNAWGQNLDAIDKLRTREFGKPEIMARYLMAMIVPGLVAGAVSEGGPKDGDSWAKWTAEAIAGEYAATVPLLRDAYSQVVKGYHAAGLPPFFKALAQLYAPFHDIQKAATGQEVEHPIKDVGDAGGLLLPGLSQLSASGQFIYDEATGKQHAESVADWARGLMSGNAKKD